MIILGIDPGSQYTGYGLIEAGGSGDERLVDFGVLRLDSNKAHAQRLKDIYEGIDRLVDTHAPDECAIEMPVYGRNPQSMLKLGRAQAAAMLALLNRDLSVAEYTPKQIKKAAAGNGNASKKQVWYMVKSVLDIEAQREEMKMDASDALAVALCHAHRSSSGAPAKQSGSWARFVRDNPDRVS